MCRAEWVFFEEYGMNMTQKSDTESAQKDAASKTRRRKKLRLVLMVLVVSLLAETVTYLAIGRAKPPTSLIIDRVRRGSYSFVCVSQDNWDRLPPVDRKRLRAALEEHCDTVYVGRSAIPKSKKRYRTSRRTGQPQLNGLVDGCILSWKVNLATPPFCWIAMTEWRASMGWSTHEAHYIWTFGFWTRIRTLEGPVG